MRSTFKVLFYVKKGSEKPNGNLPLMCRITVDGEIKQFSCKMDVPPRLWDVKNSRASGKSVEAQRINLAVDKIRVDVNRRYQELMQTDGYVTAAKLKDAYLGIGVKQETLLKLFEQHNAEFEKKVGHSRAQGTFTRYRTVCNHIREFLPHAYKREDIPLKELNLTFINDFEYFLRTEKKCRTNTVWGYMIVLKHIVSIARNDGRLPFNPFAGYINSPESVDRGYLTQTEIQTLMNAPMKNATHELVRNLFVFSVFTGLAYSDVKNNRASGKSVEAQRINLAVDKIRVEVNRRYQELMQTDGYVTAAKLKDAYLGIGIKQETLLKLFEQHNAEFAKKVGHGRTQGTFTRYRTVCNHIREFLPHTYKREDIPLKELNLTFINDFEYFLRTEKKCRTNTVWGYMIALKHIVSIARNDGRLPFNPFAGYINSPESVDRGYLTRTEIQTLMDAPMKNATHELVRDLFVFSVFTGLAYSDVKNLTADRLQTFFDGNLWIITRRKKTNTESNIRLLDVPKHIIEKYKGLARDGHVFPVPSNGSCNKILKEIGRQCGFKVRLTYHVARHTNATTVLLSNGVPIETVSRLLGHTNIKTTQIYAKITAQKISQDMEDLSHKLEDMEKSICRAI